MRFNVAVKRTREHLAQWTPAWIDISVIATVPKPSVPGRQDLSCLFSEFLGPQFSLDDFFRGFQHRQLVISRHLSSCGHTSVQTSFRNPQSLLALCSGLLIRLPARTFGKESSMPPEGTELVSLSVILDAIGCDNVR